MNKYNSKTIFHLPGVFVFSAFYREFLKLYRQMPEAFMENMEIGSIYGAPAHCIWNGGRFMYNEAPKQVLLIIKEFMKEANIPVRLTFTNSLIEDKHLQDTYCNLIADIFNETPNEILCNSDILEDYLRKTYTNYQFISSTTKVIKTSHALNEEVKNYKLVVLDYSLNKNIGFIKKIKNPEKIEVLCNETCREKCTYRKEHYQLVSKAILNNDDSILHKCTPSSVPFYLAKTRGHFVSRDDINEFLSKGIYNFKLVGRQTHILDLIEILLYYLVKDSYQDEMRSRLQGIVY